MFADISEKIGVGIPNILLPRDGVDLTKWSVVACDQYTSQHGYWEDVEKLVGDNYSTLRLVLPEVYLEGEDKDERIKNINNAMESYINEQILVEHTGFIYIDRETSHTKSRKGLILAIDLEKYNYRKGSETLVRATEGTVLDRLPPRVKIRENATIELPHIMLLIDDPDKTVIEPIAAQKDSLKKLYDFDLMKDGGHIKGYMVDNSEVLSSILTALSNLASAENFSSKYGVEKDKGVLLFAAGDGNHSLASAKAFWEEFKKTLNEDEVKTHPARYALVEVVNVHDDGLVFEPIHRVVFNVDIDALIGEMKNYFNSGATKADIKTFDCETSLRTEMSSIGRNEGVHLIPFITQNTCGAIYVQNPPCNLEVGTLQNFLDHYLSAHEECKIDYIHGEDVVRELGQKEGNIGFFLPAMDKHDLFKTVILDGALPRKTFSMGEAEEKRFYLECRKIR